MSVTYFTSDLHLHHELVATLRGYNTPTEHDDHIAQIWDETVKPDDQVWILGDLSSGSGSSQYRALEWVSCRPGRKYLITGNHDGCHPMHRNSHKWLPDYMHVFEAVQMAARRRIAGANVLLSHFPYENDRGEPRYNQWRLRDEGLPIIHGHTHTATKWEFADSENGTPRLRSVHVGWDAWRELVPLSIIENEFRRNLEETEN